MAATPDTGDLLARFGPAKHPDRAVVHPRPTQATDDEIEAAGQISAAFETLEHARGHLYAFHRMSGTADLELGAAIEALRAAGHESLADEVDEVLVGRDVVGDRWTFQLVEAYDAQYYQVFRAVDEKVRQVLAGGTPHVYEAEMKRAEQGH